MVSTSTIIGIVITLFVTLILPFIVAILFLVFGRGKGVWKGLLLGAVGFILLQLVIRIPILNVLSSFSWFVQFAKDYFILYSLLLALTAALFEVIARFGVAKILQKKMNYQMALAAGFGHGGIEAVILIGLSYINNLVYSLMINTGAMQETISTLASQEATAASARQLELLVQTILETPSYAFYLAGYERILTVVCHTAMSLLVCYFVYKKKDFIGVALAFSMHFVLDFAVPLLNALSTEYLGSVVSQGVAYLLAYGLLSVITTGAIICIWRIIKKWKTEIPEKKPEKI